MKKIYLTIISLLLLLTAGRSVLAIAAPVTNADWNANFQSKSAIDTSRTTALI